MQSVYEHDRISNLLLVDDDCSQLQTLQDILEYEGFSVIACATISEVMQQVHEKQFKVAVIDLRLTNGSGIELLEKLQAQDNKIQIVIHTGYGTYESAKDALNLGAFAYVEKAGKPDNLLSAVHSALHEYNRQHINELEMSMHKSEEKFTSVFNEVRDAIWISTLKEGRILDINHHFETVTGYHREDLIGKSIAEIDVYSDINQRDELRALLEKDGAVSNFEIEFRVKNGDLILVDVSSSIIHFGDTACIVFIGRDITERRKSEKALRESEEKYRTLVESSPYCIHQIDSKGRFISMNRTGLQILKAEDESAILGLAYLSFVCDDDRESVSRLMDSALSGEFADFEFRSTEGLEFRANFVPINGTDGKVDRLLGITIDITERKLAEKQLSYQVSHDALTGLINRREFERRAERLLATIKRDNTDHALCFLDLDQFKVVNDTCGHMAGDEMLRQLGSVLQAVVRQRDTLARLGGDEFGVLMEHCTLEHAQRVATSLQTVVQDYQFSWQGQSFRVGVSIGLVAITESIPSLTELLKQADAACYMAKDLGRNRIHVYHPEDEALTRRHGEMQWVSRIHQALEDDRFCLYAQVIEPLDKRDDKHYELLIRMEDEQGEIIPPGAFLPAAERYNLIERLDRWVIEKAFTLLAENPEFQKQICFISINLSGQSLANLAFLDFIRSKLEASGIIGEKVCFEITETAAISNLGTAIKFIITLKELGCRFALDDFGSGLSSFGYLKNLPVDYLKIDGIFVKDIVEDPIDRAMVKSINEIGQVMGMQTIAEFVEDDVIKGMLKEIGVNYAQGYGIGKPLPFDELLQSSVNNDCNTKSTKEMY